MQVCWRIREGDPPERLVARRRGSRIGVRLREVPFRDEIGLYDVDVVEVVIAARIDQSRP
jgi:hypothetical protein